MSSEERRKILQMVENGRVSAGDAALLMQALDDETEPNEDLSASYFQNAEDATDTGTADTDFEQVRSRARRFSAIPLWVGVFLTIFSAWMMYSSLQSGGTSFWFYILVLPFTLGLFLIFLGAQARTARWLYLDVRPVLEVQESGLAGRPFTLGVPLPFILAVWFFRLFGSKINGMSKNAIEAVIQFLDLTRGSDEPFIIHVDSMDGGQRVRLLIG